MNIRQIERLREAARQHGEVYDLLQVLATSFPFVEDGNNSFHGSDSDIEYLRTAILTAEFAEFDKSSGES